MKEALEGVAGGADEDEVCCLAAGLEAEAGASELDEGGCAPSVAGTAGDDALTVLCADDEGSLFEAGNNSDAGGFGSDVVGDAFIGRIHEFMKYLMGGFDAVVEFLDVGGGRRGDGDRHGQGRSRAECLNELSHCGWFSLLLRTV